MRYFTYHEPDDNGVDQQRTLSEEDIRKEYWTYWYSQMCKKYGKSHVDKNYSFTDCIDDWAVVHWAHEVTTGDKGE